MVAQVIRSKSPDILGLQGATLGQTKWLNKQLPAYGHYAPSESLELGLDLCPILYAKETYELVDYGSFLMGESSSSEQMALYCVQSNFLNWVSLRHKADGKMVYVFNTRVDKENSHYRSSIADRMHRVINELAGDETYMILGDLDSTPDSKQVNDISSWAKDSSESSLVSISDTESTYAGWSKGDAGKRVDYIFLSNDIPANSYEVLDTHFNNEYPSDHLPIYCKLRLQ